MDSFKSERDIMDEYENGTFLRNKEQERREKEIGEQICTQFKWVGLDEQKKIVNRLNNMTKDKNHNNSNEKNSDKNHCKKEKK